MLVPKNAGKGGITFTFSKDIDLLKLEVLFTGHCCEIINLGTF